MYLKILLFLLVIGFIAYKINKAWKKIKTLMNAVQKAQNQYQSPKTIKKDNLTIIYPSQPKKENDFQAGEYIDFEEESKR